MFRASRSLRTRTSAIPVNLEPIPHAIILIRGKNYGTPLVYSRILRVTRTWEPGRLVRNELSEMQFSGKLAPERGEPRCSKSPKPLKHLCEKASDSRPVRNRHLSPRC